MKQLDYSKLLKTDWVNQFTPQQLSVIKTGIERGLDVSHYANPEFDEWQMYQIRNGVVSGVDVSIYAKPEFDSSQMSQILSGLEDGIDVSSYAKPEIGQMQMKEIRAGLVAGLDVSVYAKPDWTRDQMRTKRLTMVAEQSPNMTLITFGKYQGKKGGKFKCMPESVEDVLRKYASWNLVHVVPLRENGQYVAPQADIVTLMSEHENVFRNGLTLKATEIVNRLVDLQSALSELSEAQPSK